VSGDRFDARPLSRQQGSPGPRSTLIAAAPIDQHCLAHSLGRHPGSQSSTEGLPTRRPIALMTFPHAGPGWGIVTQGCEAAAHIPLPRSGTARAQAEAVFSGYFKGVHVLSTVSLVPANDGLFMDTGRRQ
jgi:hypothetical protein